MTPRLELTIEAILHVKGLHPDWSNQEVGAYLAAQQGRKMPFTANAISQRLAQWRKGQRKKVLHDWLGK